MIAIRWVDEGGREGKCDDSCHFPCTINCDCLCGGIMHGSALDRRGPSGVFSELRDEIERRAEQIATAKGWQFKVTPEQLVLFY